MNKFGISMLLFLLLACVCSEGQAVISKDTDKYDWFDFRWEGYTVAGQYFDKAALMVPVRLNELNGNYIVQFDMGSNATMLYGNSIVNYFGSRANLLALVDTTSKEKTNRVLSRIK
ncbi:MAG TPA: hypothetical protein VGM41_06480 [Chitinophagaceae bacterium]